MEKVVNSYSAFDIGTAGDSLEIHNYHGMKKSRRLTMEQVRALEKSFQLGNTLEPGRKEELAGALGLHPKQIAIWFQNRRARWKTQQLEKDFGVLKQEYDSFKARYQTLLEENQRLQSEVKRLSSINDQSKKDKEIMGVGQIDFKTVKKITEECYVDSNTEDNITQHVIMEETCGQNVLLSVQEEEDCYYSMDETSGFMWFDHWAPSFH